MSEHDPFVEEHRKEIEEMAYRIYEVREHYHQPDTPVDNFKRAAIIIKEKYQEKESHNAK